MTLINQDLVIFGIHSKCVLTLPLGRAHLQPGAICSEVFEARPWFGSSCHLPTRSGEVSSRDSVSPIETAPTRLILISIFQEQFRWRARQFGS